MPIALRPLRNAFIALVFVALATLVAGTYQYRNSLLDWSLREHHPWATRAALLFGADASDGLCLAAYDDRDATEVMLDHGANIEANCYGGTPLAMATRARRREIVRLLLARGANPMHGAGAEKESAFSLGLAELLSRD
jgi:hypothetical protein